MPHRTLRNSPEPAPEEYPPEMNVNVKTLDDLKDLPTEDLQVMQEKLAVFLQRRMQNKKKEALKQIQHLVAEHEIAFQEVMQAVRVIAKRGKAPALYRNPENPRQTWSGKGDAPAWFENAPDKEALRIKDL